MPHSLLALNLSDWLPGSLWALAIGIATAVISLWAARWYVLRLPSDYFADDAQPSDRWRHEHPALRIGLKVLKNVLGVVLLTAGLVMLLTPGQGILAILIGLSLVDFPGKRQLQRRLIAQPRVLGFLNLVRRRAGKRPFETG
ncbi:MAG: PGPGW domain-containing protein [Pirellulales bacterium]